ncbi:MAG TPA: hypothetical protein VL769_04065 [Acidimicrobiia bacterium]|jgi:hypothetical protein|nr:hypothetical protein [Acidimicrobiia bacterium]
MNARVDSVVDAGLALLDRQILDCEGRPIAKVDDLEVAFDRGGRPYVAAILCGPGAAGPRIGGRIGRSIVAVWRRLHPAVNPRPAAIPMNVVAHIDSAVHLSVAADATTVRALDHWAAEHMIDRIPGAGHDS